MRVGTFSKTRSQPWLAVSLLLLCASFFPAGAAETPATGDWLVSHILSDPEQLNPLTSNDSGSASILRYIFESLLDRHPQTMELRPKLATARPHISDDKLTYTFTLRRDAHFQDGKPLTGQDVLFSVKAIKNPWVNAPFLRVYYQSLVQAELVDDYTLRLVAKEPYFLNETVLGQVPVLPRHYYDPDGSMDSLSVTELAAIRPGDAAAEASPQGTQARKFAEQFNTNFSRNPMGSGPYKFHSWQTGQAVVLQRDPHYWGVGKEGIDQPYIDQRTMRVFNNPDAALVALKAGELDTMGLMPIQHLKQTSGARFDKQFAKHQFFTPSYSYIGWNNAHPRCSDVRNHKFEAVILGWGMPAIEPDEYQVWHSSQAENKGSNHVSYKNARADALLEEYRRTFDAQKRIELYREFQQILHQEQPYTFLFIQKSILAVDRRFQNITLYPGGPRALEWWVPQAQQRYHEVSQ